MRFGHFFYPTNLHASQDYKAIEASFAEVEHIASTVQLYRGTMLKAGFESCRVEAMSILMLS
jgi:hypothetical protein